MSRIQFRIDNNKYARIYVSALIERQNRKGSHEAHKRIVVCCSMAIEFHTKTPQVSCTKIIYIYIYFRSLFSASIFQISILCLDILDLFAYLILFNIILVLVHTEENVLVYDGHTWFSATNVVVLGLIKNAHQLDERHRTILTTLNKRKTQY